MPLAKQHPKTKRCPIKGYFNAYVNRLPSWWLFRAVAESCGYITVSGMVRRGRSLLAWSVAPGARYANAEHISLIFMRTTSVRLRTAVYGRAGVRLLDLRLKCSRARLALQDTPQRFRPPAPHSGNRQRRYLLPWEWRSRNLLPLPVGEGRGEGNPSVLSILPLTLTLSPRRRDKTHALTSNSLSLRKTGAAVCSLYQGMTEPQSAPSPGGRGPG